MCSARMAIPALVSVFVCVDISLPDEPVLQACTVPHTGLVGSVSFGFRPGFPVGVCPSTDSPTQIHPSTPVGMPSPSHLVPLV